jgi:formate dehydrogenase iron-sulfur subunit
MGLHDPAAERMGFFTDTTVCIGCKACEVACKQWNDLPGDGGHFRKGGSYDHTGQLDASTWRHVRFVESLKPAAGVREDAAAALAAGGGGQLPDIPAAHGGVVVGPERSDEDVDLVSWAEGANGAVDVATAVQQMDKWLFMSDVCKHCTNAGCLDACPTGALVRTEFETVIVQADVCNGCGYCVPSCPFGVVARDPYDGRAAKCTLCYDRLRDGMEPACAKACPTDSIQFGPYEELVDIAKGRVTELHSRGVDTAYLYGAGDEGEHQIAGGLGAFFLLTQPPERFGLPAQAQSPIQENAPVATIAGLTAAVLAVGATVGSFAMSHHNHRRRRARRWRR